MANPNKSYIAISASFTPSGGSLTSFTDFETFTYSEAGQEVDMTTDASAVVNGMYIDSLKGECVITSSDVSLLQATTSWAVGNTGSLVVTCALRKAGIGQVSASNRVVTMANAQVRGMQIEAGATGASRITVRFGCYDPAGVSPQSFT